MSFDSHPQVERHPQRHEQPAPRLNTTIVVLAWGVLQHPEDPAVASALARTILRLNGDDPDGA